MYIVLHHSNLTCRPVSRDERGSFRLIKHSTNPYLRASLGNPRIDTQVMLSPANA